MQFRWQLKSQNQVIMQIDLQIKDANFKEKAISKRDKEEVTINTNMLPF